MGEIITLRVGNLLSEYLDCRCRLYSCERCFSVTTVSYAHAVGPLSPFLENFDMKRAQRYPARLQPKQALQPRKRNIFKNVKMAVVDLEGV